MSTSVADEGENLEDYELAEPTYMQMVTDCIEFRKANHEDLSQAGSEAQNGHDFWLTRERHGAGFWDRGYPRQLGQRLTDAAHAYGSLELYVGDDDLVYALGYEEPEDDESAERSKEAEETT